MKHSHLQLEAIVTECLQRQYRFGKISDQAFDMLCDDDSRVSQQVSTRARCVAVQCQKL